MAEGPIKCLSGGQWEDPRHHPAGKPFISKTFQRQNISLEKYFHWEEIKSEPRATPDRRLQIFQGTCTASLPQLLHDQIGLKAQQKGLARERFPGRSTPLKCLRHHKSTPAVGKNERSKALS